MAAVSLWATPNHIVVDTEAGQTTGTTIIKYGSGEGRVFVWTRVLSSDEGGPVLDDTWQLMDPNSPIVTCTSRPCDTHGTISVDLAPGQIWEGRLYLEEESDPNDPGTKEGPVAQLVVPALAKPPAAEDLIDSTDSNVGGTWIRFLAHTDVRTFCVLLVGEDAPVEGLDGVPWLPQPQRPGSQLHTVFDDVQPFGEYHEFLVESVERSIMPGNDFHFLLLAMDAFGNWDIQTGPFTTLRRAMTIDFDEIHIVNDGVPGDGVGHFSISLGGAVFEGICSFGPIDISDRPDPGEGHKEHIPLPARCPKFVLPSTQVTHPHWDIELHTRGRVERTFGEDDIARNSGAKIPIPEGIDEVVINRPFATRATPEDPDDEFTYDVKTRVTIKYGEGF
jgi:hypothetical protein